MNRQVLRSLARALAAPATQQRTRHKGIVASTSPLTVTVDGGSVAVPAHALGHYTPVVADIVMLDNLEGDIVIVGVFSS